MRKGSGTVISCDIKWNNGQCSSLLNRGRNKITSMGNESRGSITNRNITRDYLQRNKESYETSFCFEVKKKRQKKGEVVSSNTNAL